MLTAAVNQDVWSLRNLGFTADPFSTATLNTALTDPLEGYDVVFNTANWPSAANPLARTRLTAFFARGGGYLGAGANGGNFLTTGRPARRPHRGHPRRQRPERDPVLGEHASGPRARLSVPIPRSTR